MNAITLNCNQAGSRISLPAAHALPGASTCNSSTDMLVVQWDIGK